MQKKLSNIIERWFILEPALFEVMCMHLLVENSSIACPLRCGQKRIEYNPDLLSRMTDSAIDEALKSEAMRILLKHPYSRRPEDSDLKCAAIGSNMVISDNYTLSEFEIEKPSDMDLPKGMPYEWYVREVQKQQPPSGGQDDGDTEGGIASDTNTDLAGLWEEDDLTAQLINGIIQNVKDWGSLSGKGAEIIQSSLKAKIDWRKALRGLRGSILSSRKVLTRMKPSRRYGFAAMGSKREFDTKLLVAVDVSGSISTQTLRYFYGVIESAFKYGFQMVDTLQFDCGITTIESIKKATREICAVGRGGTSFQEPIDYAHENGYDGLVILTDGYAPEPNLPVGMKTKILWVCEDEQCYNHNGEWMRNCGRVTIMNTK